MIEIKSILCPVDFSAGSSHATDYASGLAEKLGAKVHVLHVYALPVLGSADAAKMLGPEVIAQMGDEAARSTNMVVESLRASGVEAEPHIGDGAPYAEIIRFAQALDVDLIVMGTHGRTGMSHLLIGSVAEKVCRLSPIPVLTVRMKN
jgi:universal stress protein A